MTILFMARLFYPHIGGVEKHVFEISKQLIKDGHNVIVIAENAGYPARENIKGITIYRIPVGKDNRNKKFHIWFWLYKHRRLFMQADIIHCHDVFFWYIPFYFFYIKKPVYITFHGYETVYPPRKRAIIVRKFSEMLAWGNICVGRYIAEWYGTKPTYVTFGAAKSIAYIPVPHKQLTITFIGRLEKDTAIRLYIQVLRLLQSQHIPYTFIAYGDGSLRKEVEQYGTVYDNSNDMTIPLQKTTIVFASSYLTMLEAFAAKRLVFAGYDNALKRDYLSMTPFTSWIVKESQPQKIVTQLCYFLKHTDKQEQLTQQAYAWVTTQTWENLTHTYYALWKI